MFALLTLPRGLPVDPEALVPPARNAGEAPVGIIIRPGPIPMAVLTPLRHALAAARA
jgi:hypothetical protein